MTGTMTSKGQVTIPVEARTRMGLHAGSRLEFVITEDQHLEIIPLSGSVKRLRKVVPRPKRTVSLEEMDAAIATGAAS
jgi:AbrB family looped-hinge helix DNA binding protein